MKIGFEQLHGAIGTWEGFGHAQYPTIEPIDYREELIISCNYKGPVFHYVQRTWKIVKPDTVGEPIFWESGFLIDRDDSTFELVSAQKSGRVETLRGPAALSDGNGVTIELASANIINDDRLIRTWRRFVFSPNSIRYQMKMSTKSHPMADVHLLSELTKVTRP